MKKPTQCHLWQKDNFTNADLLDFEIIKTFIDESHFIRKLVRCKQCGQLYFNEFYEWIDWENGNDPQYVTWVPVETKEEIETLRKTSVMDLLHIRPCLRKDFPKHIKNPVFYWLRGDEKGTVVYTDSGIKIMSNKE